MIIYTDGSCRKNPGGPGGFAVVVVSNDDRLITTHTEYCDNTTNNREELKAILWAFLKYGMKITDPAYSVPTLYTDSAYCLNIFTNWMFSWQEKGWLKADGKIPENLDLIKPFYQHWIQGWTIQIVKVKGHNGDKWNELADKLAGNYSD